MSMIRDEISLKIEGSIKVDKPTDKKWEVKIVHPEDARLRSAYNRLTEAVYGFQFEDWYQAGCWKSQHVPYVLVCDDEAAANVSVNIMELDVFGERKAGIQLGTVMTAKEYRGQGFAGLLMEKVLEEYRDRYDMIYLFANDTVLDFYPRYGFEKLPQFCYAREIRKDQPGDHKFHVRKLHLYMEEDKELAIKFMKKGNPFSSLAMVNNAELYMFYVMMSYGEQLYYIEELEVLAFAEYQGDRLILAEVLCEKTVEASLLQIMKILANDPVTQVELQFTPKETEGYHIEELKEECTLFCTGKDTELFRDKKCMFPVLSHT